MFLNELFEDITRTGEGKTAVIGWGRGMGHKGHMYLASAVIHKAKELGADPYFVVSRTIGKDDPITPEEKLAIYKKVFPDKSHIFQTATEEMPDLTRILSKLNKEGYQNAVVVVGADQVKAFGYVKNYNGAPDKSGTIHYDFDDLQVISRQETGAPDSQEEGPRATPMRNILMDPKASEEEKFKVWRDAMNPEIGDDEVRDLMKKAQARMSDPNFGKKKKVDEISADTLKSFAGKLISKHPQAAKYSGVLDKKKRKALDLAMDKLMPASAINKPKVPAREAFDNVSPVGGKRGSGEADVWGNYGAVQDVFRASRGTNEEDDQPDKTDTVTMDIPLLIRMLEYAREEAKSDIDLHDIAEKMIALSKHHDYLCMQNYNDIVDEDAAGVGIITKQNTTVDVNKDTPRKNLKAFRL
jgi:hypothetical protein